ncbi:hypothetical protein A3A66_04395 [Microgenomates group bacterium RIFCSPLOWO2_01_FULL_46_13]|nr:MAG: hypothetical protein A2783_04345 [Microgenomates group bacterium RIFCSPHIGHO2_01_FULL_45_11]OGV94211.1 MAG: hypothetical protein A3A66_04395 [Microgenomates group bacterium RIFCSPLOWO2_01_FULL_46_13]
MSVDGSEPRDYKPTLPEQLISWLKYLPEGLTVMGLVVLGVIIRPIFPEDEVDSGEDLTDGEPKG